MTQFYESRFPPKEIIVSHRPENLDFILEALSQKINQKITITHPKSGKKKNLIEHALQNATDVLDRKRLESQNQEDLFVGLKDRFHLDFVPELVEIYDNSHISGTHAIGVMVCADKTGFLKIDTENSIWGLSLIWFRVMITL